MISVGSVLSLFLWSSSDFKFVNFAMELGRLSSMLSHNTNAWRDISSPKVDGTSVSLLPPIDNTCNLETKLLISLCNSHANTTINLDKYVSYISEKKITRYLILWFLNIVHTV